MSEHEEYDEELFYQEEYEAYTGERLDDEEESYYDEDYDVDDEDYDEDEDEEDYDEDDANEEEYLIFSDEFEEKLDEILERLGTDPKTLKKKEGDNSKEEIAKAVAGATIATATGSFYNKNEHSPFSIKDELNFNNRTPKRVGADFVVKLLLVILLILAALALLQIY